jgi:hypothetical protein
LLFGGLILSAQPADAADAKQKDSYYNYRPAFAMDPQEPKKPDPTKDPRKDPMWRLGRDTWIHWTWGNQKIIRQASVIGGNLAVPVSVDMFRILDSRKRGTRFRDLGLINEPNCEENDDPSQTYGLYLDKFNGDPYYPVKYGLKSGKSDSGYADGEELYYPEATKVPVDPRHYGYPTGIVGLRLFKNPLFDDAAKAKWDVVEYFKNPGKMEPPYLVGFSCGFCHVSFNPNNPPADPENPRWENLAANIGNQYLREGEIFFGKGRVVFGDKHPDPAAPGDPYKTSGLSEQDFLYHYAVTQQPGTSETSRFSYDFINNPNTMNPLFGLRYRPTFKETTPWGTKPKDVMHILKDGADSIGIEGALLRVPINIGCEGNYWIDRLFAPLVGRDQRPFRIAEVLSGVPDDKREDLKKRVMELLSLDLDKVPRARAAELQARYRSPYGQEAFGQDWLEAWRRLDSLKVYLSSYEPAHLKDAAKAGNPADADAAKAAVAEDTVLPPWNKTRKQLKTRGAAVFVDNCARCHISIDPDKRPTSGLAADWQATRKDVVLSPDFPVGNFLSDDERCSVTLVQTNMARALATNAVDHDVWAEFSSQEYKALERLAPETPLVLHVPVFQDLRFPRSLWESIRVEFDPPGGGRGYYRTPSLISMWSSAPYLHNNSVGDYVVLKNGKREFFPNDGRRIGERHDDGTWEDYTIDYSVEGRLMMFEDGMNKLLYPERRKPWVKRTSSECALVPDLAETTRQVVAGVAHEVLKGQLQLWMRENQFVPAQIDEVVRTVDGAVDRAIRDAVKDGEPALAAGRAAVHAAARAHADRFFDRAFDEIKGSLGDKLGVRKLPLEELKQSLRRQFLERVDRLGQDVQEAMMLKVPAGTPVNLYLNLGRGRLPDAILASARLRQDPRALAKALLEMSTCPDLVENHGHRYGAELSDEDKAALIEFVKTF